MNLERGETVYYRLLQLDMFGIWMSQSFGEYLVSKCHPGSRRGDKSIRMGGNDVFAV